MFSAVVLTVIAIAALLLSVPVILEYVRSKRKYASLRSMPKSSIKRAESDIEDDPRYPIYMIVPENNQAGANNQVDA